MPSRGKSQQLLHNRLVKLRGEKCEQCGISGPLEAHHIIHFANDGQNTDDNAVLLCWNCHQLAHGNRPKSQGW